MKLLKIILIIIVALIILLTIVYAYYGGFKKLIFRIVRQGGEFIVFEEVTGDYSESEKVIRKICQQLINDEEIRITKKIGIYFDDSKKKGENMYAEVGCIIENINNDKQEELKQKYKIKVLPETDYIITEFPYYNNSSVMIGIMKIYPAFEKYMIMNGYNKNEEKVTTEIYDMLNKKIIYRKAVPVNNQNN